MNWDILVDGFSMLQLTDLLFIVAGVLIGIIAAAIPGLSGSIGIALLLPFTFILPPITSLACLGGLSVGGLYGGSISAILLNIPGCGAAVATSLDGYPMAQKGRAAEALYGSVFASFFGSIIGFIALAFLIKPLATLSLRFGPVEFFWLAILGLGTIASLTARNLTKGVLAGLIGMFLSIVGLDPLTGTDRFSMGIPSLTTGVNLVPTIIGMFAIPPLLQFLDPQQKTIHSYISEKGLSISVAKKMVTNMKMTLLKSSCIGTIVGIIPGAGGYVAALVAYSETKGSSKESESFGQGNLKGVVSAEAANSATGGGALVPTLTFGIPGSNITAVLLGALLLQGIEPGPDLLVKNSTIISAFIISLFFSSIVMLFFGIFAPKYLSRFLRVPGHYLLSSLLVVCVVGAYAINSDMVDIYSMFILGFVGYFLQKMAVPLAPIVLGLILGSIAEKGLRNGLALASATDSTLGYFFLHPVSIAIISLTLLFVGFPLYRDWSLKRAEIQQSALIDDELGSGNFNQSAVQPKKPMDFLLAGLFIILSIIGLIAVRAYPTEARVFPIFCLASIVVFSMILIVQNILREEWATAKTGGWGNIPEVPLKKVSLITACLLLFVMSIQVIGFAISSFLFILAATFITEEKTSELKRRDNLLKYLVFSCVATLTIYLFFLRLLNLSLPLFPA